MLRIRTIAVAAVTLMTSVFAASGAFAQTATSEPAGKPLLIQLIARENAAPSGQADNSSATSTAGVRKTRRKRFARRRHRETAREIDQRGDHAASPDQMGSDGSADSAPANATPAAAAPAPTADIDHAQQDDASLPSAVVVDGRTVAIAPPDQINALDLAAENSPPLEPTLPPHGDRADVAADGASALQAAFAVQTPAATNQNADTATSATPTTDVQNAGAPAMSALAVSAQDVSVTDASDQTTSNQDASDQKTDRQDSSTVGSLAWIAQAFAALGGAVAAGVVAWFLIGAAPVRTYH